MRKQPNILFIMADQFRWDGIGKVGGWASTPALNRIAEEGLLFANCITNSPVCIPARVSLATGLYPHNTGVWSLINYDMPEDTNTWMQAIKSVGYRTSLFGKTHWHRHEGDLRDREHFIRAYGFDDVEEIGGPRAMSKIKCRLTDVWEKSGSMSKYLEDIKDRNAHKRYIARPSPLPLEEYADVYIAQRAKNWLKNYSDSSPWFCMLSFGGPHEPWDAPEPYASLYDPDRMPKPINGAAVERVRPIGQLDQLIHHAGQSSFPTPREIAEMRSNYAGNISLIDDQIGEILQVLEEKNCLEQTVIVFTSDHGEMNGDHGLLYKKNFLKSSVQVPMIVRTPDTCANRALSNKSYAGMVELMDIGPTLVEIAGGNLPYRQFGRSLLPVLEGLPHIHRQNALSEISGELMLQTEDWKIAVNAQGETYMLYDLRHDPEEVNNLAADPAHAQTEAVLRSQLLERIVSSQILFE